MAFFIIIALSAFSGIANLKEHLGWLEDLTGNRIGPYSPYRLLPGSPASLLLTRNSLFCDFRVFPYTYEKKLAVLRTHSLCPRYSNRTSFRPLLRMNKGLRMSSTGPFFKVRRVLRVFILNGLIGAV